MSRNRLQRVAHAALGMTIIDNQCGAAIAHAPADFERGAVGAPFEQRTFGSLAKTARQSGFEVGQSFARKTEAQSAIRTYLDHTLMPTVHLLDSLMHGQSIDELIGNDDGGSIGDIVKPAMP